MRNPSNNKKTKALSRRSGDSLSSSKVKSPEEVEKEISTELAKFELEPVSKVEVTDPITKEKRIITLDRTGHTEAKLITALADPNTSRDRKDHELSMYLFSRGAESASFLLDLARSKGEHVKETRVFKSQIRFDFEALVDMLADHLHNQAMRTAGALGIDLKKETQAFRDWLSLPNNKGKGLTYWDFARRTGGNRAECVLISNAMFDVAEAERLQESRTRIQKAREAEKGGGIYVDAAGKVYSTNDPELEDVIKADRETTRAVESE